MTTAAFEYGTNFAAGFQSEFAGAIKNVNISESFNPKGESSSNRDLQIAVLIEFR